MCIKAGISAGPRTGSWKEIRPCTPKTKGNQGPSEINRGLYAELSPKCTFFNRKHRAQKNTLAALANIIPQRVTPGFRYDPALIPPLVEIRSAVSCIPGCFAVVSLYILFGTQRHFVIQECGASSRRTAWAYTGAFLVPTYYKEISGHPAFA